MDRYEWREYDVVNEKAIEYYRSLPPEELDRLIAAKEQEIEERRKRKAQQSV